MDDVVVDDAEEGDGGEEDGDGDGKGAGEDEEIAMVQQATTDLPAQSSSSSAAGGPSKSPSLVIGGGVNSTKKTGVKINAKIPGKVVEAGQEQTGRWTKQEHEAFLLALRTYRKEWEKVAAKVKTRAVV